jgi:hypothetical protein
MIDVLTDIAVCIPYLTGLVILAMYKDPTHYED